MDGRLGGRRVRRHGTSIDPCRRSLSPGAGGELGAGGADRGAGRTRGPSCARSSRRGPLTSWLCAVPSPVLGVATGSSVIRTCRSGPWTAPRVRPNDHERRSRARQIATSPSPHRPTTMLLQVISSIVLVFIVGAPTNAETSSDTTKSAIVNVDDAARGTLSSVPQERRDAIDWLMRHGDRGSVAVLIQLLRWLPGDQGLLVARLEALTGARAGSLWFDWMVWQQAHSEVIPYPGYKGFPTHLS